MDKNEGIDLSRSEDCAFPAVKPVIGPQVVFPFLRLYEWCHKKFRKPGKWPGSFVHPWWLARWPRRVLWRRSSDEYLNTAWALVMHQGAVREARRRVRVRVRELRGSERGQD